MTYAAQDRHAREERKRIEIMCRVPVSYRVLRGSEVEPPRPARGKWVYELLGGEHREIIERCGDYATEAEARTAAEAILGARRLNTHDPNPAKRMAAWLNVGKFIERQKATMVMDAQDNASAAKELEYQEALLKAREECASAVRELNTLRRSEKARQDALEAEKRATLIEQEANVLRSAEACDRDADVARSSPLYLELLKIGNAVLDAPSSFKRGGSRSKQIYGIHAVEASGERLDEVRAFRSMQRRGYSKYSPWDQPWPADTTEQNYLRLIARAQWRRPWRIPN